jgi:peptidoglycan/xylan/chitin deacetylase (PgdA/CDA1 family)
MIVTAMMPSLRGTLNDLAKRTFIRCLNTSGFSLFMRPWYSGRGVILMFHRVIESDTRTLGLGIAVTTDFLDGMISYVKKLGWHFVRMGELKTILADNGARRFVCCTFDDGFADNLTLALPICRRHGVPLSVYPSTGFLDRLGWSSQTRFGYILLDWLLLRSDRLTFPHPAVPATLSLTTPEAKKAAYKTLLNLEATDPEGFARALQEVFRRDSLHLEDVLDEYFLTWVQARELSRDPLVEIGVHGVTHRPLAALPEAAVRWELSDARRRLHDELGIEARHIAYPYGSPGACAAREYAIAQHLGFETGVTTRQGNIFAEHRDRVLALPRTGMSIAPHGRTLGYVKAALYGSRNGTKNRFRRVPPE